MSPFCAGILVGLGIAILCWYAVKLLFVLWLGPMLDKHDRGHK